MLHTKNETVLIKRWKMPELPEVETTMHGIMPYLINQKINLINIRQPQLRWKIPDFLSRKLTGKILRSLERRGKYLLFHVDKGTMIMHLGMSGSLRIISHNGEPNKHDHVDIFFANQKILRYTDPRRFGAILWVDKDEPTHPLLANLGPEPLTTNFSEDYLYKKIQGKKIAIKSIIMNSKIVVGVGNIYATEALFLAKIHPLTPAKKLSTTACGVLVQSIKKILQEAIYQGGTTIKDFVNSEGKPGYFSNELKAYGREGMLCIACKTTLQMLRINGRATVYCPQCQKEEESGSSTNDLKIRPCI